MSETEYKGLSRRDFVQGAAQAAGAVALPLVGESHSASDGYYPAPGSNLVQYDFTTGSAALQPDRVVNSACQFCNCACRLKVYLKKGRVIDIRGEADDPVQAGGLCIKGPMMAQLVYNRFRLTHPLKRIGGMVAKT
jgi:anaerobic selenocysteine-containing dehydrogenase